MNELEKWELKTIDDIGEIVGGGTPPTMKAAYYGGTIPWLSPRDLSGYSKVFISGGGKNITELGLKNSSAKMMPEGTVLFSSRAPIGYVAIAKNEISTNQGFKSIICNKNIIMF
jgi:type I restriction enzyme S subunit